MNARADDDGKDQNAKAVPAGLLQRGPFTFLGTGRRQCSVSGCVQYLQSHCAGPVYLLRDWAPARGCSGCTNINFY